MTFTMDTVSKTVTIYNDIPIKKLVTFLEQFSGEEWDEYKILHGERNEDDKLEIEYLSEPEYTILRQWKDGISWTQKMLKRK